eukprot:TRINITY_DN15843_c0_g1_i10.p1 TRINITY_DN15843_c0_g1~~TRINITY_DN15843_c0_g1_i10.p1  ORF type:complete len:442 (-),score=115.12 TRINITY_DN15843_c0_g1_i10:64-1389(-)
MPSMKRYFIVLFKITSSFGQNISEQGKINNSCPDTLCFPGVHTCIAGVAPLHCSTGLQCCIVCDDTCEAVDGWFQVHRDNFCDGIGGSCKHESNYCEGSYEVGMCGGPADRKCCAPSGTFSVPLPHFILQTILLVLIILANTLVISVTIYDKELHTIPNIGISSLALADLLLAVTWFIIQLLVFLHSTIITNIDRDLRHIKDLAFVFEMSVILHILLITADRYTAILHPLAHYKVFKSGGFSLWKVFATCLSVWCAAAFLAYTRRFSREWTYCYMSIIMNVVRTILPLMVTAMLNIIIFIAIRNRTTARVTMESTQNIETEDFSKEHRTLVRNKRAVMTISLILISIMVSYLPLRIITMISVCGSAKGLYENISNYIVLLKFLNSITNPTIYMLTTRQFKQAVKNFFHKSRIRIQPENKTKNSEKKESGNKKISLTCSTSC